MMNTQRLLRRTIFCSFILIAFLLIGKRGTVFAQGGPLHISIQADRLTVKVTDMPVVKVLREIARKGEIMVYDAADLSEDRITIELSDLAIQEGLAKILGDFPVDQIVETLRSLNDPQIRVAILTSGLELPHEVMADHALHDPSPQVRIGALHALEPRRLGLVTIFASLKLREVCQESIQGAGRCPPAPKPLVSQAIQDGFASRNDAEIAWRKEVFRGLGVI